MGAVGSICALAIMAVAVSLSRRRGRPAALSAALAIMLMALPLADAEAKGARVPRPAGQVHLFRGVFGIDGGITELQQQIARRGIAVTAYSPGEWESLATAIGEAERSGRGHGRIVLVGYSLGGAQATKLSQELAQAGVPVDLLITLDAPDPLPVAGNVREAVNLYQTRAGFFRGRPLVASGSFRGRLINKSLDTLPDIEHHDFVRHPQVLAEVVREVTRILRR
jgi:thioesterase domain-containing protein